MNTNKHKRLFGLALKEKLSSKIALEMVGAWCYEIYLDYPSDDDLGFSDILKRIATMEMGPEFFLSYEELDKIADDLIAGKEVKL